MKITRNLMIVTSMMTFVGCGAENQKEEAQQAAPEIVSESALQQDYAELPAGLYTRLPIDATTGQVIMNGQAPELREFTGGYISADDIRMDEQQRMFEQSFNGYGNPISDVYADPYNMGVQNPYMINSPFNPDQFYPLGGKVGQYPGQNPGQHPGQNPGQHPGQYGKGKTVYQHPGQTPGQNPGQYGKGKGPVYQGPVKGGKGKGGYGGVVQGPYQGGKGKGKSFYALADLATSAELDFSFRFDHDDRRRGGRRGGRGYGYDRYDYNDYFMNQFRPIRRSRAINNHYWGYYTKPIRWVRNGYCYYYYPRPRCNNYNWCNRGPVYY